MKRLTINGILADLPEIQAIALTRKIVNWQQLSVLSANYSSTVELPFSQQNNRIFEFANSLTADSPQLRNFYSVNYVQDSVSVATEGVGVLLGTTQKGYRFAFYWGNIDLKHIFGDKTLQDLDLSEVNHTWSLANALPLELFAEKLAYFIFNFEKDEINLQDGTTPATAVPFWLPFVSIKFLLDKICEQFKLIFNGFVLDHEMWLPVTSDKYLPAFSMELGVENDDSITPTLLFKWTAFNQLFEWYGLSNYNKVIKDEMGAGSHADCIYKNTSGEVLTVNFSFVDKLRFWFSQHNTVGSFQIAFNQSVQIRPAGGVWSTVSIYDFIGVPAAFEWNKIHIVTMPARNGVLHLQDGWELRVRYTIRFIPLQSPPTTQAFGFVDLHTGSVFKVDTGSMTENAMWDVASNLPDIPLFDFVKEICFLNGYLFESVGNNVFNFKKVADILTDEAQDLSNAFQSSFIENFHTELAQHNHLMYSNESYHDDMMGSSAFVIDNNTLDFEDTFFESKFAASREVLWRDASIAKMEIKQVGKEGFLKVKPRLFFAEIVNDVWLSRHDGTAWALSAQKYKARFAGLEMGIVAEGNYSQYIDVLQKYKEIEALMNLSIDDFLRLDLLKPVFIRNLGGLFVIKSVDNFVSGKLCKIKLIKI